MNLEAIRRRLDEERRSLVRCGEIVDRRPRVTRVQIGESHLISYSSLEETTVEGAIAEEVEHYASLGAPFEWKVYSHDRPADLLDRLARADFDVGPSEAVMVYDLADAADWLDEASSIDAGVRIRPIERVEEVDLYRQVYVEVFGDEPSFDLLNEMTRALAEGSSDVRGYVAFSGDRAIAASRMYTHPQSCFAGLYGGGVIEAYRGRGVYRAMVAARARDARKLQADYLLVDALPTSRPILERLGFQRLSETWPCERQPTANRA